MTAKYSQSVVERHLGMTKDSIERILNSYCTITEPRNLLGLSVAVHPFIIWGNDSNLDINVNYEADSVLHDVRYKELNPSFISKLTRSNPSFFSLFNPAESTSDLIIFVYFESGLAKFLVLSHTLKVIYVYKPIAELGERSRSLITILRHKLRRYNLKTYSKVNLRMTQAYFLDYSLRTFVPALVIGKIVSSFEKPNGELQLKSPSVEGQHNFLICPPSCKDQCRIDLIQSETREGVIKKILGFFADNYPGLVKIDPLVMAHYDLEPPPSPPPPLESNEESASQIQGNISVKSSKELPEEMSLPNPLFEESQSSPEPNTSYSVDLSEILNQEGIDYQPISISNVQDQVAKDVIDPPPAIVESMQSPILADEVVPLDGASGSAAENPEALDMALMENLDARRVKGCTTLQRALKIFHGPTSKAAKYIATLLNKDPMILEHWVSRDCDSLNPFLRCHNDFKIMAFISRRSKVPLPDRYTLRCSNSYLEAYKNQKMLKKLVNEL